MAKKRRIMKKPYCSPEITKVDLRSEEAVLAACKTDAQAVAFGTDYTTCKYHGSVCSVTGS